MYIPLLLGTGREGRFSEAVAKYLLEKMKKQGWETELIDVRDLATSQTIASWMKSDKTTRWKNIVVKANALVIVSPEYNHGYPGELKIVLDQAYSEYAKKPVLLAGVSEGAFGGARMVENLLSVLQELNLRPVHKSLYFPFVKVDFTSPDYVKLDEKYTKPIEIALKALEGMIKK